MVLIRSLAAVLVCAVLLLTPLDLSARRRAVTDLVQIVQGQTSGTSVVLTFTSPVTTGNSVVCLAQAMSTSISGVTDTQSNSYTDAGSGAFTAVWYAHNVTGGSSFADTVSSSGAGVTAGCYEIEGDIQPDVSASAACSSTLSCDSGSTSTRADATEIMLGGSAFLFNHNVSGVSGSWTAIGSDITGLFSVVSKFFYWHVTSTGTDGIDVSYTSSGNIFVGMMTFKSASAPPPATMPAAILHLSPIHCCRTVLSARER